VVTCLKETPRKMKDKQREVSTTHQKEKRGTSKKKKTGPKFVHQTNPSFGAVRERTRGDGGKRRLSVEEEKGGGCVCAYRDEELTRSSDNRIRDGN